MKNILLLIKKDIIRFLTDKPAVLLTFLVPAVLIVIFGSIFGGGSESRGKIPIILVNQSENELAKFLEEEFDSSSTLRSVKSFKNDNGEILNIDTALAREFVAKGKYPAALIMPEDFFTDTSSTLKFKFLYDPRNEIESQLIQGTIQKTIFSKLPKLFPLLLQNQAKSILGDSTSTIFKEDMAEIISDYFDIDKEDVTKSMTEFSLNDILSGDSSSASNDGDNTDFISNLIKFDSEQLVGKEIKNPGVTRIVGGWAIMFLLFTLSGVATSIFEEKQEGTLKRLFCMPVTRNQYLWAKYIYSILVGIVQLSVLFIFAYLLYDVDIFINIINLIVVIIVSASAAVAFGMIIISLSNSLAQANGIATLLILIMSALGGSWFPVSLFPEWLQFFSKFTLTYWSVEGFLQVLWRNAPFDEIFFPYLVILLGIAIIVNFAALYLFKKRQVV